MKIIFASRSNCLTSRGGDTIQMLKTKEFIEKNKNDSVSLCLTPDQILDDKEAKVVHIFNIQTIDETLNFIKASKESGKKIVLSTIYWDLSHQVYTNKIFQLTNKFMYLNFGQKFKKIFDRSVKMRKYIARNQDGYATTEYINNRRKALLEADLLLPNSFEELEYLCDDFNLEKRSLEKKTIVIPNAVDINAPKTTNQFDVPILEKIDDFVLEVARIEINKNQYNVVKALYDKPEIPIVFIGRVNDTEVDREYHKKLLDISKKRGNVYYVQEVSQDIVFEYYKKAKVHILPSFRESPGLSSLEALYFGCEIVTSSSEYCPIEYYKFNQKAHVCNPYDTKSIKDAILNAFSKPKNIVLDADYFSKFSYSHVATLMKEVYSQVVR